MTQPTLLSLVQEATASLEKLKRKHAEVCAAAEEDSDLWTANAISECKELLDSIAHAMQGLAVHAYGEWASTQINTVMTKHFPNWPNPSTNPYS